MRGAGSRIDTERVLQFLENESVRAYALNGTKVGDPIHLDAAGVQLLIDANERFGEVSAFSRFMAGGGTDIVQGVTILGAAAASRATPSVGEVGPSEPYNRQQHYGKTPTAADRRAVGAGQGEVADHQPSLVKRYYEGDPDSGEKPGYLMTEAERKASAADRTRMRPQPAQDSAAQGAAMARYSREMRRRLGL
jgi:hypothetical protein